MAIIRVTADGWLFAHGKRFICALGKTGTRPDKREGDGATPEGAWPLRAVFYRADRILPPVTRLPLSPIMREDGWCDDSTHPDYNRRIKLPHPARHEILWREDSLYDLILVLGYNDAPVVAGKGSAIFMHVARPGWAPTEGCVALAPMDLRDILAMATPGDAVTVTGPR
ncbi:MAG TPA: L,D-transpeptidase family protein [Magnetospirillaceae bacterium]|jgi:L,D-peptidoglycan transpeptidase YkuD (ErfK/YbiS/YcfS/YnhG family)